MDRRILFMCVGVGSTIGGYLPTFVGFGAFSLVSFVGGAAGAIAGVWAARRIDESF
ncbi:MAG TPA: hypothetical protein VMT74_02265 [Gaiellaceae bacterium]|nr:hypothetical protein [Gaiellaceae bacterium]